MHVCDAWSQAHCGLFSHAVWPKFSHGCGGPEVDPSDPVPEVSLVEDVSVALLDSDDELEPASMTV